MTNRTLPTGPDAATIAQYIRETYPETAILEAGGTWFFSLDPEKHFPNPHPTYAAQLWISILNPSAATFGDVVVPLIAEAHDRLAAQRARHGMGDLTTR